MPTVSIHPPKTPVTKGANSVATATIPNVCKMPGPPAPFVPTPLPNIGQSGKSPQDFTTTVSVEGHSVATHSSSYGSSGDIASKGTGGGVVSNNAEGPTKFIAPGSMTVKMEGKNVQLLGDQTFNNCGPGGNPPNAATMMGTVHGPGTPVIVFDENDGFKEKVKNIRKYLKGAKTKNLNRLKGKQKQQNRRQVCGGRGSAGQGLSWDEFPFASSTQGGDRNTAEVAAIPAKQNSKQGGVLGAFYKKHGIEDGDAYIVEIRP